MTETQILLEVFRALKELVELKEIKEKQGETEDYLKRKPAAWATAKRLIAQHKNNYWGVRA